MRSLRSMSVAGLAVLAIAVPARAAEPTAAPAPTGFRADYVQLLAGVEKELVSLEQAMPQDKFGWRPAKGVRSVGEVYLHAAGSVYFFVGKMGRPIPANVKALFESDKWESQTTKKDDIKTILTTAIEFLRKTTLDSTDADLDKSFDFFGKPFTERALLMATLGHLREHLGQSIAYARTNGVVPPWSKQ
jgi:uncharacterized damage-inducible protein DinB